jgi:hypothetical protein
MADNLTTADGVVSTKERTIASVAAHVQRMGELGSTAIATGQVTPTASAATLLAARETRKSVTFVNLTNMSVFIGPATVTTANGFELPAGAGISIPTTALLQVIVASVTGLTGDVQYIETYDS